MAAAPLARERAWKVEMHKEIFDLDAALSDVELAMEKLRFESRTLANELGEKQTDYKNPCWCESSRIRADIILDYVVQTDEALKAVRELCDKLFEKQRAGTSIESSEALTYRAATIQLLDKLQDVKLLSAAYTFVKAMSEHK